ncbi:MAG: hypothetical protein GY820_48050 [Gammaproteobacteria bacterium]|nr:hypothetical protein [Gammaproteobacteria bacterium]
MNDIYAAPEANLRDDHQSSRVGGNIEDAIAGNIEISMLGTMGEAWRQTKGFKWTCHLAFMLYFVAYLVTMLIGIPVVFGFQAMGADQNTADLIGAAVQMIASIAVMPIFIGIHILGMQHAENKSISATSIFGYFNKTPRLFLCYILMILMILLGTLLLVIPGIYLMIAYMFAMALVVEKDMPAWRALETSRKVLTRKWFPMLGILMLIGLINMLGILTLTIAWIWTIPWSVLTMSMIYTRLFGAEAHTLAD